MSDYETSTPSAIAGDYSLTLEVLTLNMARCGVYTLSYGRGRYLHRSPCNEGVLHDFVRKVRDHNLSDIVSAAAVSHILLSTTDATLSEIRELVGDEVVSLVEELQFLEDYDLRLSELAPKIDGLSKNALLLALLIISFNMENIKNRLMHPSVESIADTCEDFVERSLMVYAHLKPRVNIMTPKMGAIVTEIGEMVVPALAKILKFREGQA